jgi:DtxR family Mn-dependent transcriptional regulator
MLFLQMTISLTEENYIKAIFNISNSNNIGVSTNSLSNHLENKASSVTDMLKKLADKKLIHYKKYKGVLLTPKGEKIAINIIRKHRLWEVFLMEKLNFSWDQVHDIAEQLEHIKSDELIKRLDDFLGKPTLDPHGDPIPNEKGKFNEIKSMPLNECKILKEIIFIGVKNHTISFLKYLTSIGLRIGDRFKIEAINNFDNSYQIKVKKNNLVFLSNDLASNILVKIKNE